MVTPSICKLCNEIPLTHKNIEKDLRNILLSVFLHLEECVFCMKQCSNSRHLACNCKKVSEKRC